MPGNKTLIFYFCGTALDMKAYQQGEIIATLFNNSQCDTDKHDAYIYDGPGSQAKMSWEKAMGAMFGDGWEETVDDAKAKIQSQINDIKKLLFIGYSRGAIECMMLANACADVGITIDTTIIALDPVPGPWKFHLEKCTVPAHVSRFYGIYAQHEPIKALRPVMPNFLGDTEREFILMPGNHMTMANIMKASTAKDPFGIAQDTLLPSVGKIIQDFIEKRIIEIAGEAALVRKLNLSLQSIVQLYRDISLCSQNVIASLQPFIPLISNYGGIRHIYNAEDNSWPKLSDVDLFTIPEEFVNSHHQEIVIELTQAKQYSQELLVLESHIQQLDGQAITNALSSMLSPSDYKTLLQSHRQFDNDQLTCIINAGQKSGLNSLKIVQMSYQQRYVRVLKALFENECNETQLALGDGRDGNKHQAKDTTTKLKPQLLNQLLSSRGQPIEQLYYLERIFCYLAIGQDLKLYTRTSSKYALFLFSKRDDNITLSQTQIDHIELLKVTANSIGAQKLSIGEWGRYQDTSPLLQFDNTHYQAFCKKDKVTAVDDLKDLELSNFSATT